MGTDQQWNDAYHIAEKMYRTERSMKRSDLDMFEQLVCDRYCDIFDYDPYKDTFSFRNQILTYVNPIKRRLRQIAEVDLDLIRNNTVMTRLTTPCYQQMTPIFVAPPSTFIVYNHSRSRSAGLSAALAKAARDISKRPSELDMKPGAEFLYLHKDGKLYRTIVLLEKKDANIVSDGDRRYEVAFVDICKLSVLRLKNLFMPLAELSLDRFPCSLHCARLRGIGAINPDYIPCCIDQLRELYLDKERRTRGLTTRVYESEQHDARYVVDFPSLSGMEMTESESMQAVSGHLSTAPSDPKGQNYQQIMAMETKGSTRVGDDDQFSPDESNCVDISMQREECPFTDEFLQRRHEDSSSWPFKNSSSQRLDTSSGQQQQQHEPDNLPEVNTTLDESISLASIRSYCGNTPLPTFDSPPILDSTPKKKQLSMSSNEWDEATPKKEKSPQVKTANRNLVDVNIWGSDDEVTTVDHRKPRPMPPKVNKSSTISKNTGVPSSSTISDVTNVHTSSSASFGTVAGRNTNHWSVDSLPVCGKLETGCSTIDETFADTTKHTELDDDVFEEIRERVVVSAAKCSESTKSTTMARLMFDAQENFHDDAFDDAFDDDWDAPEKVEDSLQTPEEVDEESHAERVISDDVFDITSVRSSEVSVKQNQFEEKSTAELHNYIADDEFSQVSEALKSLAEAFAGSARQAALKKNWLIYITEVHSMESIAIKLSEPLDRRFWKTKVDETKQLRKELN